MTKLVLQFDNADDLIQLLLLLKEHGMERLAFGPQNKPAKRSPPLEKENGKVLALSI